jgi:hypothetical protein
MFWFTAFAPIWLDFVKRRRRDEEANAKMVACDDRESAHGLARANHNFVHVLLKLVIAIIINIVKTVTWHACTI